MTAVVSERRTGDRTRLLQRAAAGLCLTIAVVYGLIWSGAVTVVADAEPGELGVLGVAGLVFLVLAAVLWRFSHWALWGAVALFQLPIIAMYLAIGRERDPAFEFWGIWIRVLQLALIGVLVTLVVGALRARRGD